MTKIADTNSLNRPLLPKATAMWLVDNTKLTFRQIATFCGMHELEVQTLADGEVTSIRAVDPIAGQQLTAEEIKRCEADEAAQLRLIRSTLPAPKLRTKGPRYTPLNKRSDKPDAIAWIVKNHPEITNAQISKLVGTTKGTIENIRTKSHWNIQNIKPRHPVELGLCGTFELDEAVRKAGGTIAAPMVLKAPQPFLEDSFEDAIMNDNDDAEGVA